MPRRIAQFNQSELGLLPPPTGFDREPEQVRPSVFRIEPSLVVGEPPKVVQAQPEWIPRGRIIENRRRDIERYNQEIVKHQNRHTVNPNRIIVKPGYRFEDAYNAIKDASSDKLYVVELTAGVFDMDNAVTLKPYVAICGAGHGNTRLRKTSGIMFNMTQSGQDGFYDVRDITLELNAAGTFFERGFSDYVDLELTNVHTLANLSLLGEAGAVNVFGGNPSSQALVKASVCYFSTDVTYATLQLTDTADTVKLEAYFNTCYFDGRVSGTFSSGKAVFISCFSDKTSCDFSLTLTGGTLDIYGGSLGRVTTTGAVYIVTANSGDASTIATIHATELFNASTNAASGAVQAIGSAQIIKLIDIHVPISYIGVNCAGGTVDVYGGNVRSAVIGLVYTAGILTEYLCQYASSSGAIVHGLTPYLSGSNIQDDGLTASRAVISNGNKVLISSAVTGTELGYVSGVTSAIQTQLDGKSATSHTHTGVYQPLDAQLTDIAGLAVTADNFIVGDGTNFILKTPANARTSLGLGTIATQAANNVAITGGSITGITDLAVADGGTGASTFGAGYLLYGNTTSAIAASANLTYDGTTLKCLTGFIDNRRSAAAGDNASPLFLRRSCGSIGSESAIQSGDAVGAIVMRGYGATGWLGGGCVIKSIAAETFTDSVAGQYLSFLTNPIGAISSVERVRISSEGVVTAGSPTVSDSTACAFNVMCADNAGAIGAKVNATQANVTGADYFLAFYSTTGLEGSVTGSAVAGVLAFNTFTGSHWTQVKGQKRLYDLLESCGEPYDKKPHLVKTRVCSRRRSPAVFGIYGGDDRDGNSLAFGLGLGWVRVLNTNTDLVNGDYVMSSDIAGVCEKQDDDILHNYTVAKLIEDVTWKTNEVDRLVRCSYHCS